MRPRKDCTPHEADTWWRIETPHFVLRTNQSLEQARQTARLLEVYRMAMWAPWKQDGEPPIRADTVVLRSREHWAELYDPRTPGFVQWAHTEVVIRMAADFGRLSDSSLLAHELTHFLSLFVLRNQPRWLAEGLARFMETATLHDGDRRVELGELPHDERVRMLTQGVLPLEELWAWDTHPPSREDLGRYYMSAWAWVHYLHNAHRASFAAFQQRLASGIAPAQAWREVFGQTPMTVAALKDYLEYARYSVYVLNLPQPPAPLSEGTLSAAEVHLLRARLRMSSPGVPPAQQARLEAATRDVREALRHTPDSAEALALALRLLPAEAPERLTRARELAARAPEHPEAVLAVADTLGLAPEHLREREALLRRAARQSPGDASLQLALARTYLAMERPANAQAPALRALKLAPWSVEVLTTNAAVHSTLGHCEAALAAQHAAIGTLSERVAQEVRNQLLDTLAEYERKCAAGAVKAGGTPRGHGA
ncbi:hypothetical protein [Cystobacter fuscus]|uniref:hypothetical protein n=1 Tax=Cystobacter fuscus TaxID=43 RepID=UPI002B2FCE39|nr:hypothetical protein F0U63_11005 [Cystobacter fuscus]